MSATMFLVRSDAEPKKFLCEGRWVERGSARRYSLTEATKDANKMRAAGASCSLEPL